MTWLLSLIMGAGVPAKLARPVLYAIGAVMLLGALWGAKCAYDKRVIATHEAKIEQRAKPATDKAAAERATDTITNAKTEQEAHDAIHAVPDATPSGPSHALACKRLRDLGHNPPACR